MINNELKNRLKEVNNPKEIINILELYFNVEINNEYLIIFDEIQELKNIRTSLKFFNENMNNIKIIGLGSYLSNAIFNDHEGFPVGKVETLYINPLTFFEFIKNIQPNLIDLLNKQYNEQLHNQLIDLFKTYCIVGGMPEIIINYLNNESLIKINQLKNNLFNDYKNDISKEISNRIDKTKATFIFDHIINFLDKENNSYSLSIIDKNARYRDYENALVYLLNTHIVNQLLCVKKLSYPLFVNEQVSKFKLFFNDIGFISYLINVDQKALFNNNDNERINNYKESICEQFVFNELRSKLYRNNQIYFYKFIVNGKSFEVDFILSDTNNNIIPIEVKSNSNKNIKPNSLINLIKNEKNIKYAIVLSLCSEINIKQVEETQITFLPIYFIILFRFIDDKLDLINLLELINKVK